MADAGTSETEDDEGFVTQHASLVRRVAGRLRAQLDVGALDLDELHAWGNLGLLEARRRFDPDRGVRFSTFAYYRIRGAILDGIRRGGYLSRRAHAKLRAAEAQDALSEPQAGQAARDTSARARALDDTLGKLTAAYTIAAVGQDTELRDEPNAEQRLQAQELAREVQEAVARLPERERALIRGMYFEGRTLEAMATELGLSKSWGSRLHAKILGKLREEMLC